MSTDDSERLETRNTVPHEPSGTASAEQAPRWLSEQLLQGHPEAVIVHGGEVYRLRRTRNGKLILHK